MGQMVSNRKLFLTVFLSLWAMTYGAALWVVINSSEEQLKLVWSIVMVGSALGFLITLLMGMEINE